MINIGKRIKFKVIEIKYENNNLNTYCNIELALYKDKYHEHFPLTYIKSFSGMGIATFNPNDSAKLHDSKTGKRLAFSRAKRNAYAKAMQYLVNMLNAEKHRLETSISKCLKAMKAESNEEKRIIDMKYGIDRKTV